MNFKYLFWALLTFSLTFCACDALLDDEGEEGSENGSDNSGAADKEAYRAFSYINEIRANPAKYSSAMGVNLSGIQARPALKWNSTLAKVAQEKADDMVKRRYYAHVDPDGYGINFFINKAGYELNPSWYSNKSLNYFESIGAGYVAAEEAVKQLIYDKGYSNSNAGHRSHLLGISDWNASLCDIGIGHAYGANTDYKHYWSFIIAKHDF